MRSRALERGWGADAVRSDAARSPFRAEPIADPRHLAQLTRPSRRARRADGADRRPPDRSATASCTSSAKRRRAATYTLPYDGRRVARASSPRRRSCRSIIRASRAAAREVVGDETDPLPRRRPLRDWVYERARQAADGEPAQRAAGARDARRRLQRARGAVRGAGARRRAAGARRRRRRLCRRRVPLSRVGRGVARQRLAERRSGVRSDAGRRHPREAGRGRAGDARRAGAASSASCRSTSLPEPTGSAGS